MANEKNSIRTALGKLKNAARHAIRRALVQTTGYETWRWRKRGISDTEKYWTLRDHPSNQYMLNTLAGFEFSSLLEIGSNCGPRLFAIGRRWPGTRLLGIDINPSAVAFGNSRYQELGWQNVQIQELRIEDLSLSTVGGFDLCFSWASLIYIRPKDILEVLENIRVIAAKGIILFEMHSEKLVQPGEYRGRLCGGKNWKRNYRALLQELGVKDNDIQIEPIAQDVWSPGGGDAACIIVRKQ